MEESGKAIVHNILSSFHETQDIVVFAISATTADCPKKRCVISLKKREIEYAIQLFSGIGCDRVYALVSLGGQKIGLNTFPPNLVNSFNTRPSFASFM